MNTGKHFTLSTLLVIITIVWFPYPTIQPPLRAPIKISTNCSFPINGLNYIHCKFDPVRNFSL